MTEPQAVESSVITPTPRFARIDRRKRLALPAGVRLLLGRSIRPAEQRWAVAPLIERLAIKRGDVRPLTAETVAPADGAILVGSPKDHPLLGELYRELAGELEKKNRAGGPAGSRRAGSAGSVWAESNDSPLGTEGYLLAIDDRGVRIVADSPAGAFYAVQALLQLLGKRRSLPRARIADAPAYPIRGYHIPVHGPENLPDLERLIAEVLPRHKCNMLLLGLGYRFKFVKHPEIHEKGRLTAAQSRRLARLGRQNNVRVIPVMSLYGHQGKPDRPGPLLRAYPEFNETPGKADIGPCGYNMCPSDPRVYRVLFDLIDEMIDAFETDTIHLGMDEVFEFGQCKLCRGKTPADSFALAVNTLYGHAAGKRKRRVMIWGDRLVDGFKTPYNPMNGSRVGTYPARKRIPRDVLLCDWHYHLHEGYPSVDQFERAGLDYVICPWWKHDGFLAFSRYADEHSRRHLRGVVQTNWHKPHKALPALLRRRRPNPAFTGVGVERREIESAAANFIASMEWAWTGRQDTDVATALARHGPPAPTGGASPAPAP